MLELKKRFEKSATKVHTVGWRYSRIPNTYRSVRRCHLLITWVALRPDMHRAQLGSRDTDQHRLGSLFPSLDGKLRTLWKEHLWSYFLFSRRAVYSYFRYLQASSIENHMSLPVCISYVRQGTLGSVHQADSLKPVQPMKGEEYIGQR
jgi:hypothetical protein